MMKMMRIGNVLAVAVMMTGVSVAVAQDAAPTALPKATGTVKSVDGTTMVVTTATGDYTVSVPGTAKVLVVPPGAKDLKTATAGTVSDVAAGDKAIVTGTAGDTGTSLHAARVILMKSGAIAQSHAAEEAAWAQGSGGIVKSVDAGGALTVSRGLKPLTVTTSPTTIVRRYSGDSVAFADATMSTLGSIKPGDQIRVRGAKSADGDTIAADEIVAGTFRNFSGLIASIDSAAGTVTLKDLASKKTVTVVVSAKSDVRRIPTQMAMMLAARMKGTGTGAPAGGRPAGGPPAGGAAPAGGDGAQRVGRAGADLSSMLSRLPTETLGGLKAGDAVMIVATSPGADSAKSTAVTLLVGVDAILTAAPEGQGMTLTPWSVGGGAPEGQ